MLQTKPNTFEKKVYFLIKFHNHKLKLSDEHLLPISFI